MPITVAERYHGYNICLSCGSLLLASGRCFVISAHTSLSWLPQKPILIQISQFQSPSEAKLPRFRTGLRVHWDSLDPSLWTLTSCQSRSHLALDTCCQRPPDLSQALTAQNLTHRLTLTALSDFQAAVALVAFSSPSCWVRTVRWVWKACPGPGDNSIAFAWCQQAMLPYFPRPLSTSACKHVCRSLGFIVLYLTPVLSSAA